MKKLIPLKPVAITAIGSYVPSEILTNDGIRDRRPADIPETEWTDDSWIFPRTGIKERRVAPADWGSSDLMVRAAQRALANGSLGINEIDLIVTSTSFPDKGFNIPRTAEIFKNLINAPQSCLDLEENAECAGFEWALIRAQEMMTLYDLQRVLVVSGDKVTAATNYRDRKTCPLFGDSAGAVILTPCDEGLGILASTRGSDTKYIDAIQVPAGGSKMPTTIETLQEGKNFMVMPGGADMLKIIGGRVFPDICHDLTAQAGISLEQIRHIIPHQANIRISLAGEARLKHPVFKETQMWFGNTSGSSVILALDTLYLQGNLNPGDYVLIVGFGAGFIWAGALIRWTIPRYLFKG